MEGFRNTFTAFQSSSAEGSLNMTYSCGSGGGFEADIFTVRLCSLVTKSLNVFSTGFGSLNSSLGCCDWVSFSWM